MDTCRRFRITTILTYVIFLKKSFLRIDWEEYVNLF